MFQQEAPPQLPDAPSGQGAQGLSADQLPSPQELPAVPEEEPGQASAAESDAMLALRAELAELREAMAAQVSPPPPGIPQWPQAAAGAGVGEWEEEAPEDQRGGEGMMAAFHAFASGEDPGGPMSRTAGGPLGGTSPGGPGRQLGPPQAQLPAAAAPPGLPELPAEWRSDYRPLESMEAERTRRAATMVKEGLRMMEASRLTNPRWPEQFWKGVVALEKQGAIPAALMASLRGHGYAGEATVTMPSVAEMTKMLEGFERTTEATPGRVGVWQAPGDPQQGPERWESRLPPDMQRAAPEIYRSLRAGSLSTRDYLMQNFVGNRDGPVWTDLWTLASTIDFKLEGAQSEEARNAILASDDVVEMGLRRLAAFIYERRTRDSVGAAHMLAVTAPGSSVDIAPQWLVSSATTHSKAEFQRDERAAQIRKRGKGRGKGKDKGKGDGGAAPHKT